MAIKPTINKINVFDANKEYIIEFDYQGNQPYINEIFVYDTYTNEQVYHNTIETMKFTHPIPQRTLVNGKQYYARICVYDINNEVSDMSDSLYFTCYSTPELSLTTLNSDGSSLITTSNYEIGISYCQSEGRKISEYVYYLYDSARTQIYASGTKRLDNGATEFSCPIKGLSNDSVYYFSLKVITVDNIIIEIPQTKFSVKYRKPTSYSVLNVECDKRAGYMKYNTYIVIVEGHATGKYELNNGILNIESGKIYYNTGFSINDDFVIGIKCDGTPIHLSNKSDKIILTQNRYNEQVYYKLEATNDNLPSMVQYSKLYKKTNELRTIYIKRINGIYGLYIIEQQEDK